MESNGDDFAWMEPDTKQLLLSNRLAAFVRAADCFHGVSPVPCPPDLARRAFMIEVERVKWSKRKQL